MVESSKVLISIAERESSYPVEEEVFEIRLGNSTYDLKLSMKVIV